MRSVSKSALLAATALVSLTAARAAAPASRITRDYVNAAAQSDMFERLEATTALAQSRNPAVRAFAQKMLSEHEASTDRLRQTAS